LFTCFGEHAEEYVQKAIEKGFTVYSLLSICPFRQNLWSSSLSGRSKEGWFLNDDLDGYFRDMLALKENIKIKFSCWSVWKLIIYQVSMTICG